jgi:serine/threonine protein kinase
VHLTWCKTAQEHVAIKALNLEALNSPLEDIMQETRTMKAYRNEHLLPLYCSFVNEEQLWMVMPYMEVSNKEDLKSRCLKATVESFSAVGILKKDVGCVC